MGFGHFFVDRPIFASVISIVLMIVGGVALLSLPIAQYPEIAPPTIVVAATYPGANAETIAETVASPIEQEVNGVEGMIYMTSQATGDGALSITVTFAPGTDLDNAQVQVQNRVAQAEPRLPEEVRRNGVVVNKRSSDFLMLVNLTSPDASTRCDLPVELRDGQSGRCAEADRRSGDIRIFGERELSLRVWLDPNRLASYSLAAGDVIAALAGSERPGAGWSAWPASRRLREPPSRLPSRHRAASRRRSSSVTLSSGRRRMGGSCASATSPVLNWALSNTARTPISMATRRSASGFNKGRAPTHCLPPLACRGKWNG